MKNLVIILIAVISLSGCDRVNPKNYPFYCKIDGKKFVPQKDESLFGGTHNEPLRIIFDDVNGTLWLNAYNSEQSVTLSVKFPNNIVNTGSYELGVDSLLARGTYYTNKSSSASAHNSVSGHITITKIKDKHIWGEFEFVAKNTVTGKEYKITEGEFTNKN